MLVLAPSRAPSLVCAAASFLEQTRSPPSVRSRLSRALATRARKYGSFDVLRLASASAFSSRVDVVVLAALGERPDDVGVGDVVRGPAEACRGRAGCAGEAALAVAAGQQVVAGPLQHGRVHVVDAGHVAELQQAVGGQRLVGRRLAEPLVALALARTAGTRTTSASR